MTTLNAVDCGARMEVAKQGMLCCKFNSAHKIVGVELMFDVMVFCAAAQASSRFRQLSVIPTLCRRAKDHSTSPWL
jgi:hypothetical protein